MKHKLAVVGYVLLSIILSLLTAWYADTYPTPTSVGTVIVLYGAFGSFVGLAVAIYHVFAWIDND